MESVSSIQMTRPPGPATETPVGAAKRLELKTPQSRQ